MTDLDRLVGRAVLSLDDNPPFGDIIRAVLLELRQPSESMLRAGLSTYIGTPGPVDLAPVFTAMIDHILEETDR